MTGVEDFYYEAGFTDYSCSIDWSFIDLIWVISQVLYKLFSKACSKFMLDSFAFDVPDICMTFRSFFVRSTVYRLWRLFKSMTSSSPMSNTFFLFDNSLCFKNLFILIDQVVNFCVILISLKGCFDAIFN